MDLSFFTGEYELSQWDFVWLGLAALFTGMSKTGLGGVFAAVVPLMVLVFPPKEALGVLLPMLVVADTAAISYYNRSANWTYIRKLLPWTILGIVLGSIVGQYISDTAFRYAIGGIILFGALILIWLESQQSPQVPDNPGFSGVMGLLGGFSTMVGNFAGPIITVYLLSMRLPKNTFIGTAAWFFFIINLSKIIPHGFYWQTISWASLRLDLLLIPFILIGALIGITVVRQFSEQFFRRFTIVVTILSVLIVLV